MKTQANYDVIVIGGGDAGIEAAIYCAKHKKSVAIIESDKLGGSSINYTNIPTNTFFEAISLRDKAKNGAKLGLSSLNIRINRPTLNAHKQDVQQKSLDELAKKLKENKITVVRGLAHFVSKNEVNVGETTLKAKSFLVASGAVNRNTGIALQKDVAFQTPETALDFNRPPRSIFIAGGGQSGCELAYIMSGLGVDVVLGEIAGRLIPREDEEAGQVLEHCLTKSGVKILTQTRVLAIENYNGQKRVRFLRGGVEKNVLVDEVALCTGYAPNTDLGLENAGAEYSNDGIKVDKNMRTTNKAIFAAGDVLGGHISREAAKESGLVAAMAICGIKNTRRSFQKVRCYNFEPELAATGITEDDCIKNGRHFKKELHAIKGLGKPERSANNFGFVKTISAKDGTLLGATIMMPHAKEVAHELALAISLGMSQDDLSDFMHCDDSWNAILDNA